MIELYLSSDGKHTVHVSGESPDEMMKLLPHAKMLYEAIVQAYGTKAQMWTKRGNGHAEASAVGSGDGNGQAKREAPLCPVHKTPMAFREGRYGAFWSCPTRTDDGGWCPCTFDVTGRQLSTGHPAA